MTLPNPELLITVPISIEASQLIAVQTKFILIVDNAHQTFVPGYTPVFTHNENPLHRKLLMQVEN